MTNQLTTQDELTEFLLYSTPKGKVKVEIFFQNENIWLTQKRMADLFGVNVPAISKHLKNIFISGELVEQSVISILETTAEDSKKYKTKYYNLDAMAKVAAEYDKFNKTQKIESDFDRQLQKLANSGKIK